MPVTWRLTETWLAICTQASKQQRVAAKLRLRSRSMMAAAMNRLLRPFGLKLGPLQAGAIYFPLHFVAVGIGLTLLTGSQGVGVFWPATGSLFAFLLLYPARFWPALFVTTYVAEVLANTLFAPQLPFSAAGLLFPVKFSAALLGVGLMHV